MLCVKKGLIMGRFSRDVEIKNAIKLIVNASIAVDDDLMLKSEALLADAVMILRQIDEIDENFYSDVEIQKLEDFRAISIFLNPK